MQVWGCLSVLKRKLPVHSFRVIVFRGTGIDNNIQRNIVCTSTSGQLELGVLTMGRTNEMHLHSNSVRGTDPIGRTNEGNALRLYQRGSTVVSEFKLGNSGLLLLDLAVW